MTRATKTVSKSWKVLSNICQIKQHPFRETALTLLHFYLSGRGILRPCDQYPSEPGVLNSRPTSVLSGYGIGGSTESRNGDELQVKAPDKMGQPRPRFRLFSVFSNIIQLCRLYRLVNVQKQVNKVY